MIQVTQSWASKSRFILTCVKGLVYSTGLTAPHEVKKRRFSTGLGPGPNYFVQQPKIDFYARVGDADVIKGDKGVVCTYLNGKLGQPVYKSQSDVHAIKIHNGMLFLAHKDGKLARVDPASKQEEHLLPAEKVCDVCFGPKGDMFYLTQAGEVGSASSKQKVKLQAPEKLQFWWSLSFVDNNILATGYVKDEGAFVYLVKQNLQVCNSLQFFSERRPMCYFGDDVEPDVVFCPIRDLIEVKHHGKTLLVSNRTYHVDVLQIVNDQLVRVSTHRVQKGEKMDQRIGNDRILNMILLEDGKTLLTVLTHFTSKDYYGVMAKYQLV